MLSPVVMVKCEILYSLYHYEDVPCTHESLNVVIKRVCRASLPPLESNPTIGGGRGWSKYIPHCMGGVTKRAPLGGGIEYPVSGWTSLPQTKLIPAGVSRNISPGGALLMAPPS